MAGNKRTFILILFIILFLNHGLESQILNEENDVFDLYSAEKRTFSFALDAMTFFHNNEFFETFVEGYTLTGAYFQPKLLYSATEKLNVSAGMQFLKFNGKEEFDQFKPWFHLQYRFSDAFSIAMGSYNGGSSLLIPEPMFDYENNFTNIHQEGIRIDYHTNKLNSITWLNWDTFIEPADTFREEFTIGNSTVLQLVGNDHYQLSLPLHILFHHKGGQINQRTEPVLTYTELASGLEYKAFTGNNLVNVLSFSLMGFYDKAVEKGEENGFGIFPRLFMENEFLEMSLGYFYGENYSTELGEPLYFSNLYNENGNPINRRLFTIKAGIKKQIAENSFLTLRFDGWYDANIQKLQYCYGIYIILNEWYKID